MIQIKQVSKFFQTQEGQFTAVNNVNLNIEQGDIYGIIGFSGAGKSTLVRMINLLERPDQGDITIHDQSILSLSQKALLERRKKIGMIFQHFNLLTNRTALENVELPLEFAGVKKAERRERALKALEIVELLDKQNSFPTKLSGGQKQRVAIARAIVTQPEILLCDEPTSAVDPQTKESILAYLQKVNQQLSITIVIVSHEMQLISAICNRVAVMEQGEVVEEFDLTKPVTKTPKSMISKILLNELQPQIQQELSHAG